MAWISSKSCKRISVFLKNCNFYLNLTIALVCEENVCTFFVTHERMTSGLRHTPTDTHIHTEHACTWLSWSLVHVHPWHAFYMHICHKCITKHLVVPWHLLFLPSRPMCLLLTLLKHTHAAFAAVVRNKSAGSWAHVKDLRESKEKRCIYSLSVISQLPIHDICNWAHGKHLD